MVSLGIILGLENTRVFVIMYSPIYWGIICGWLSIERRYRYSD